MASVNSSKDAGAAFEPHAVRPRTSLAWRAAIMAYLVVTMGVMVALIRVWGEAMPTHSFFYSMSWAVGFVPVFVILYWYQRRINRLPVAALDAPWPMIKQSLFVSLTYAFNYWGVSTAAPHVGGPAQVVLTLLPVGLAAIVTALMFRRKYSVWAWLGVALTIAGGVAQTVGPGISGATSFGWSIVFLAGNLPQVVWAVVFEGFHKATGPDGRRNCMEVRMMWTNIFLVGWLVVFAPLFGALGQPAFPEFLSDFSSAAACTFTGAGGREGDDCSIAGWLLAITIPVAALQTHAQILVSREETGMLATLVLTVAPFLADLAFPFAAIMGVYVEAVSWWDGVAAGLCLGGLVLFAVAENAAHRDTVRDVNDSRMIAWFTNLHNVHARLAHPCCWRAGGRTFAPSLRVNEGDEVEEGPRSHLLAVPLV